MAFRCVFLLLLVIACASSLSSSYARLLSLNDLGLRLPGPLDEQCGPLLSIETPACKVVDSGDGYELRRYPSGQIWAETVVPNSDYSDAVRIGFYRCFYFISGENSRSEKIEMTAPVLIKPVPERKGWKISFFTPSKYASKEDVPIPTNSNVEIVAKKEQLVAVSDIFGGFPRAKEYGSQWQKLREKLDKADLKYDEASVEYAGYSSPFEIFNRKQEVHVVLKEKEK